MLLRILAIISAIGTIVSLWNVKNNKKWWLVYVVATVLFVITNFITESFPYPYTVMGIFLLGTGLKNYFYKGKKNV